jgi:hypothetical protein
MLLAARDETERDVWIKRANGVKSSIFCSVVSHGSYFLVVDAPDPDATRHLSLQVVHLLLAAAPEGRRQPRARHGA